MRYARVTYWAIATGATLWCLLILMPSILLAVDGPVDPWGRMIRAFFRPLCHQLDSRTFHLFGTPLAVCSRCSCVYFGFLTGTLLYPLLASHVLRWSTGRRLLALALMPMLLDVGAGTIGLYEISSLTRAITGAWFGLIVPFLVIPGMIEGVEELFPRSSLSSIQPEKGLTDA